MDIIRIVKKIKSNDIHIKGLDKFKRKKAEFIILIEESSKDNAKIRREKAYRLIDTYSCKIMKWTRDELYER